MSAGRWWALGLALAAGCGRSSTDTETAHPTTVGVTPVACTLLPQSGCRSGQKCTFSGLQGEPGCAPAGTGGDLASCNGDGDCAAGFFCARMGPSSPALCRSLCHRDEDCPQSRTPQLCLITIAGDPNPEVCTPAESCDPLAQDCNDLAAACYPSGAGGSCLPAGSRPVGAACNFITDCAPGEICVGTARSAACRQLCDPAGARGRACGEGTRCAALASGPLGACQ